MTASVPLPPDEHLDAVARSRVGGVRVERFEGLRAGEAIAAVRRLGLRPAPERVEGYQSDLHGFVVGQEPADGGELQAGDQVVLFIAAPSRARVVDEDRQPEEDEIERVSVADVGSMPSVDDGADVEAIHAGEPGYGDETVEIHEVAPPVGRLAEPERPVVEEPKLDVRSWWRDLPLAVRWGGIGVGGCVVLAMAASLSSGGTSAQQSASHASRASRPVKIAGRLRSARRAVAPTIGHPVPSGGPRRRHRRGGGWSAARARVRVVYVSDVSAASAATAASGRLRPTEASAVESAAEHMAREFGSP